MREEEVEEEQEEEQEEEEVQGAATKRIIKQTDNLSFTGGVSRCCGPIRSWAEDLDPEGGFHGQFVRANSKFGTPSPPPALQGTRDH